MYHVPIDTFKIPLLARHSEKVAHDDRMSIFHLSPETPDINKLLIHQGADVYYDKTLGRVMRPGG
jgi:hypothetical protein